MANRWNGMGAETRGSDNKNHSGNCSNIQSIVNYHRFMQMNPISIVGRPRYKPLIISLRSIAFICLSIDWVDFAAALWSVSNVNCDWLRFF